MYIMLTIILIHERHQLKWSTDSISECTIRFNTMKKLRTVRAREGYYYAHYDTTDNAQAKLKTIISAVIGITSMVISRNGPNE